MEKAVGPRLVPPCGAWDPKVRSLPRVHRSTLARPPCGIIHLGTLTGKDSCRKPARVIVAEHQKLLASLSDGMRIQSGYLSHNAITASPKPEGFRSREESSLMLVEEADEEHDRGLGFIGIFVQRREGSPTNRGARDGEFARERQLAAALLIG